MGTDFFYGKKGSEKVFSIWWFFVLVIVGVSVITGVLIFYSADVDTRSADAVFLFNHLESCLIKEGFLDRAVFDSNYDIFSFCKLNNEVFGEGSDFYFKVNFLNEGLKIRDEIEAGKGSFEKDCETAEAVPAENFPRCFEEEVEFFYYDNYEIKSGKLVVLTASNQKGGKEII